MCWKLLEIEERVPYLIYMFLGFYHSLARRNEKVARLLVALEEAHSLSEELGWSNTQFQVAKAMDRCSHEHEAYRTYSEKLVSGKKAKDYIGRRLEQEIAGAVIWWVLEEEGFQGRSEKGAALFKMLDYFDQTTGEDLERAFRDRKNAGASLLNKESVLEMWKIAKDNKIP